MKAPWLVKQLGMASHGSCHKKYPGKSVYNGACFTCAPQSPHDLTQEIQTLQMMRNEKRSGGCIFS